MQNNFGILGLRNQKRGRFQTCLYDEEANSAPVSSSLPRLFQRAQHILQAQRQFVHLHGGGVEVHIGKGTTEGAEERDQIHG